MKRVRLGYIVVVLLLLSGCNRPIKYQYAEGKMYGTFYHISYLFSEDLHTQLREEMNAVNASLSMFDPSSVISKINRNESEETDSLFRKMFDMALWVYQQTDGGFDITVAPLVNAWGFGLKQGVFPDSAHIDSLLTLVGMDKLELTDGRLRKALSGVQLDASSIAKGLGVDLVAEYLDRKGVTDYMVEIGGEIRVKGHSSKGGSWRIGIDRPEDDPTAQHRQLQMILGIDSGALATSGNYRNFYIHEGRKYAHTINPKSGYPVQTEVLSASIYAQTCMEADAYATGCMVLGLEKAKELILRNPELEGCLIYEMDGKPFVWISDGLKKLICMQSTD